MKEIFKSISFMAAMLLFFSCNTREQLYSFRSIYTHEECSVGLFIYENADGYIIRDSCGYGPLNSKTIYYDAQGRVIAYVGTASECYPSLVKLLYDNEGRVEYIVDSFVDFYDRYNSLAKKRKFLDFAESVSFDASVAFEIFYGEKYTKKDICYRFIYDESGVLKEISNPFDKSQSIRAECETALKWSVDEGFDFWGSDIYGGNYIINIQSEHRHPDGKVSVTTYYGYNIFTVDTFCEGMLVRKDLYDLNCEPMDGTCSYHKKIVEFAGDEIIVIDVSDREREIYTYAGNYLVKYERKSPWDTVLERRLYKWDSDGQVGYMEYCYNYRTESLDLSAYGEIEQNYYDDIMYKDMHISRMDTNNYSEWWL